MVQGFLHFSGFKIKTVQPPGSWLIKTLFLSPTIFQIVASFLLKARRLERLFSLAHASLRLLLPTKAL